MLFPIIQPELAVPIINLPLYNEIAWDFEGNIPIFRGGKPVILSGKDAVAVWAWKALHVPRFRFEIYTWSYGSELESLMGQPFTEDLKRAEAARYVRDCLIINPYITDVTDINVNFLIGRTVMLFEEKHNYLDITCRIQTIYGEAEVYV